MGIPMTMSTALITTKNGTTADLSKPETFRGQTLTPEQMRERLRVLTELEEQLDQQSKMLSPKSAKELREVVALNEKSKVKVLEGEAPFPICRLSAPYYWVQFGRTKVDYYNDVKRQIEGVPTTPVQVLQAIQPMAQSNWFHGAIMAHAQNVLSSDFMDAIKTTLVGNMSILRASLLLMGKPDLFRQVLSLYSSSNDLYNKQISYNRSFELELLKNTEDTYRALRTLHTKVVDICGPTLEENPSLAQAVQQFRMAEAEVTLTANTTINTYCETFLHEIDDLKTRTQECINTITARNTKVKDAMAHMAKVVQQQTLLNEKQNQMQADFDAYQSAKQKEVNAKQQTVQKTANYKLFFITVYSSNYTVITESDFGSKDAYARYLAVKKEETAITQALNNAQTNLANTMAEVMGYGQDQESLQSAMHALSTSVFCVHQLELALKQRKRQAQDQINMCKHILQANGHTGNPRQDGSLTKVENVLAFIEEGMQATIKKQALWLASNRQTFTLQSFQHLEQGVRSQVTEMLTSGGADPTSIAMQASLLLQSNFSADVNNPEEVNKVVQAHLVPYKRMLQLTEGTSDYDQKE
jgi:hypothetical protein